MKTSLRGLGLLRTTLQEALPSDSLLPVLVFLHGGGFSGGSGDALFYGPEYLMEKGVLLVTLNYRLGPIGASAPCPAASPRLALFPPS